MMTTTGGFEPFGYVIIFKEMGDRNTWRLEKNQHRHSNVILVITTAKSFFDCFHGSAAAAAAIRLAVPKDPKKSRKVRQENDYLSFSHPLYQNGRSNQISRTLFFCFLFILVIYFCVIVCVSVCVWKGSLIVSFFFQKATMLNVEL
jgi:Flp pilus assembly protein TadB